MSADFARPAGRNRTDVTVTVAGAGVAGLTAAVELAARGIAVEVIDRASGQGPHACSWYAGGMLAPWCEGETAEEPVVRHGQQAIEWWRQHVPGVVKRGSLVVAPARDGAGLSRFARRTTRHETLERRRPREAWSPTLAGRFTRALYFPARSPSRPGAPPLKGLAARLADAGVRVRCNTALETDRPAGPISSTPAALPRGTGWRTCAASEGRCWSCGPVTWPSRDPCAWFTRAFRVYVVPRGVGVYMIGATAGRKRRARADHRPGRRRPPERGLRAASPPSPMPTSSRPARRCAPRSPDNLPRLRRRGHTLYINGLYRHGFLLAPACARMAAMAIADPHHIPEFMDETDCERAPA